MQYVLYIYIYIYIYNLVFLIITKFTSLTENVATQRLANALYQELY